MKYIKLFEEFYTEIPDYEYSDDNLKNYDIKTWKYLMKEPEMELGIIKEIDSMRTGSYLTTKELAKSEKENSKIYNGYKEPEYHSTNPNWYSYMDIRFLVETRIMAHKTHTSIKKRKILEIGWW